VNHEPIKPILNCTSLHHACDLTHSDATTAACYRRRYQQHGSYGLVIAGTRLLCKMLGMTAWLESDDGTGDSGKARARVAASWTYRLVKAVLTPLCHPTLMWPLMGELIAHVQTYSTFVDDTFLEVHIQPQLEWRGLAAVVVCALASLPPHDSARKRVGESLPLHTSPHAMRPLRRRNAAPLLPCTAPKQP
jgi:hypothetical protein